MKNLLKKLKKLKSNVENAGLVVLSASLIIGGTVMGISPLNRNIDDNTVIDVVVEGIKRGDLFVYIGLILMLPAVAVIVRALIKYIIDKFRNVD